VLCFYTYLIAFFQAGDTYQRCEESKYWAHYYWIEQEFAVMIFNMTIVIFFLCMKYQNIVPMKFDRFQNEKWQFEKVDIVWRNFDAIKELQSISINIGYVLYQQV